MQRPIHTARHARPEAATALSGLWPSRAVEAGAPCAGFADPAPRQGAGWAKAGPGTPEKIVEHFGFSIWQDRRERNRQRGRIVARP